MKPIRFSRHLPLLAVLLTNSAARAQWQTYDTVPPGGTQSWVYYNANYNGVPPNDYPGAWHIPNSWPGTGANVTIRHPINLDNSPYLYQQPGNVPVYPFPGGTIYDGKPRGLLTVSSLNIVPGGGVSSSLEDFSFDGVSTWSGGYIYSGGYSPPGVVHNRGQLSVTGPFVLVRGGSGLLNTNHMDISNWFGIQAGGWMTNLSGTLPDPLVAEIVLSAPGAAVANADGGGGAFGYIANYGMLRKTGAGTASINVGVENHAESTANQAGTVAVDAGTLILAPAPTNSHLWGLKAEIAPSALLILRGSHVFENGDTSVSGGGVLRLEPVAGTNFHAESGTMPTLSAPEGKLECAGAEMRDFINLGSINVTASASWWNMTNLDHVRVLPGMGLGISHSLFNGSSSNHTAIMDFEDDAGLPNSSSSFENHALLRKTGPGSSTMDIGTFNLYGAPAAADSGGIEVAGGTLRFLNNTNFDNGAYIRVANGAVMDLNYRNYQNGGTIHITGSGKLHLNPGSDLSPAVANNVANAGILDAAPGTFELAGGTLHGPVTNTGELTVTSNTSFVLSIYGDNTVTNYGTIHCTATSAGEANSIQLNALVYLACQPSGTLAFDIAGRPGQMTQWARLVHGQQASVTYGGKLRINFGGFVPVSGDRWLVVKNDSGTPNSGDFTSVEFTNVPGGFIPTFEKIATGIRVGLDAAGIPTDFTTWVAAQNFPSPADAAFDNDFDHDGLPNGAEYALGTDPKSPTSSPAIVIRENIGGDEFLAARFTRPGAANRGPDIQWIGEGSYDLTDWSADKAVMEYGPPDGMGKETVTVRLAEPISYHPRAFVRLRLVKTP